MIPWALQGQPLSSNYRWVFFPQSPVNQPIKLQHHRTANCATCPWQSRRRGLNARQRSRLPRQREGRAPAQPSPPKEEISRFPSSPRKSLKQRVCSYSPRQPQLSAWDHLQQYRVPAALDLLRARQLVQPRDSSAQMTFPLHDK